MGTVTGLEGQYDASRVRVLRRIHSFGTRFLRCGAGSKIIALCDSTKQSKQHPRSGFS
jgi:hypothetical protein